MKRKSLQQIHQQALDLIQRLMHTPHTMSDKMEQVIRIHNRYIANACANFGVDGMHRLTLNQQQMPLCRDSYMLGPITQIPKNR